MYHGVYLANAVQESTSRSYENKGGRGSRVDEEERLSPALQRACPGHYNRVPYPHAHCPTIPSLAFYMHSFPSSCLYHYFIRDNEIYEFNKIFREMPGRD